MRIIPSDNPRPLNLLALSSNGLVAAASSTFGAGGVVEAWDAATGARRFVRKFVRAPVHPESEPCVRGLAFLADRLLVGRYGGKIAAFAVPSGAEVTAPPIELVDPTFAPAPDGTRLLVANFRGNGESFGVLESIAAEPNGAYRRLWRAEIYCFGSPVAAVGHGCCAITIGQLEPRLMQFVSIRDAESGKERASISLGTAAPGKQLAFTADGAKLLVGTDGNKVQLFDAATGAAAGELAHKGRPFVTAVAVHPRGPVACARTDGTVTLWDAEKRTQLRTLDWKAGRLVSVAFAPDGALAAVGTEDGKIVVWDVDL